MTNEWTTLESAFAGSLSGQTISRNEHRRQLERLGLTNFCDTFMHSKRLYSAANVARLDENDRRKADLCANTVADEADNVMRNVQWPSKLLLTVHYMAPQSFNTDISTFPTESIANPHQPSSWITVQPFMPQDVSTHKDNLKGGRVPKSINLIDADQFLQLQADLLRNNYGNGLQSDGAKWFEFTPPTFGVAFAPIYAQFVRVPSNANVHIIGDLHSSFSSLISIIKQLHYLGALPNLSSFTLKPNHFVVFLGDIVDRGDFSVELLYIVGQLLLANPGSVFLLQGNHEECSTFTRYTLLKEVMVKYNQSTNSALNFLQFLNYLPTVLFMTFENRSGGKNESPAARTVQFCHGAATSIASEQEKLKQFLATQFVQLGQSAPKYAFLRYWLKNEKGPCYPSDWTADNLKWGDFTATIPIVMQAAKQYGQKKGMTAEQVLEQKDIAPNLMRGTPDLKVFGSFYVQRYLRDIGLVAIISGHQDVTNFAIVPPAGIEVDRAKFEPDPTYFDKNIQLYRPKGYREIANQLIDSATEKTYDVSLAAGYDFIAVNTSSAYSSKQNDQSLRLDCFCTLTQYR